LYVGAAQFATRVEKAAFDERSNSWTVQAQAGKKMSVRFYIMALGYLSTAIAASFPGQSDFGEPFYNVALTVFVSDGRWRRWSVHAQWYGGECSRLQQRCPQTLEPV
jgi:hypothetical protein